MEFVLLLKHTLAVVAVCAGAACGSMACAQVGGDGAISMQGQVTGDACTPKVNGGGVDSTVNLSTVSISQFPDRGAVAGWTPFYIELECGAYVDAKVWVYFSQGSADAASGRLKNTGTAEGIDLQLTDNAQLPIKLDSENGEETVSAETPYSSNNGHLSTHLLYGVRYYRSGTEDVKPGTVNATANYTVQFD